MAIGLEGVTADQRRGQGVVFVDLIGTLVSRAGGRWSVRSDAADLVRSHRRLGVLCNGLPGQTREEVLLLLDALGLGPHIDPGLIVVAPRLGCPLPDRRAFAVAAALAEISIEHCTFVSADESFVAAASSAGMRTVVFAQGRQAAGGETPSATLLTDAGEGLATEAELLAAQVDEDDLGPTFVLSGRIVTMGEDGVIEEGRLVVSRGFVRAVVRRGERLPSRYRSAPTVDIGGTIYPGLIDLHNHFAYNILPLWSVPGGYGNRSQWQRARAYVSEVSLPMNALKGYSTTARAIVRFAEAKALVGGTTTGQGIRTQVRGGMRLFRGAMRNVEATGDVRLPEAGTLVPTLRATPESVDQFRSQLERRGQNGGSYFYHLAEGVDDDARETYSVLLDNDLLQPPLVGIHCLGLQPKDLAKLASAGCRLVWSPFSNLLLYGQTLDLEALKSSEVVFSIGCDWSPTGSKNLLQELKIAQHVSETQGGVFAPADIVRAVTIDAAQTLGWERRLGSLEAGRMADLLVIGGDVDDPYEGLIDATERDIRLVAVHGVPRYGDRELMREFPRVDDERVEELAVAGADKLLAVSSPDSPIEDLSLKVAQDTLLDAMADLPAFRAEMERGRASLLAFGIADQPDFELVLDNEPLERQPDEAALLADWDLMTPSVDLDGLAVDSDGYFDRVEGEPNIGDDLKEMLRDAYS